MDRSSGILLPVSALPGPCGIGDLGADARDFIDFLAAAGQRYWQILPLNPPDGAHSPYLSASTFAGSTDLLSPEPFLARGALTAGEVRAIDWGADPMRAVYDRVHACRTALWDAAFAREKASAAPALRAALAAEPWLRDYCLYMAVKEAAGGAPWYAWPQPLRDRSAAALAAALERLDDRVLLHAYLQTEFTRQWDAVRAYAHAHGVRIIGDLPMYIAPDSADVWAQPAQFRLDPDGQPSAAAGVPPDYFSADGQLWGNPLYDWDAMRADGFQWWKGRIRGAAKRYDVVRLDHFRAISSYWVVPRGELTARGGHWAPGPGPARLQALHTAAPELELIAEDLGTIDDDVRRLVARSGCPGMRVLLFGFDPGGTSEHRPDRVRAHSVCYVGTHDTAPAAACITAAAAVQVQPAAAYQPDDEQDNDEGGVIQADPEQPTVAVGWAAGITAVTKHSTNASFSLGSPHPMPRGDFGAAIKPPDAVHIIVDALIRRAPLRFRSGRPSAALRAALPRCGAPAAGANQNTQG